MATIDPSVFGAEEPSVFGAEEPRVFGAEEPKVFGSDEFAEDDFEDTECEAEGTEGAEDESPKNTTVESVHSINWVDYNYPPCLRLVHYDPLELPKMITDIAVVLDRMFKCTLFVCILNVIDTWLISGDPQAPPVWIMYSWLNLVLFPTAAFYIFFVGYKGVTLAMTTTIFRYKLMQLSWSICTAFFCLGKFGSIHGLLSFIEYRIRGLWMAVVIVESTLWLLVTILGLLALIRANRYNPIKSYGPEDLSRSRFYPLHANQPQITGVHSNHNNP